MALRALNVSHVYGDGTAYATPSLSGVDATVEPGRLLLVAGATGSGKTTLLKLLAGLLPPTEGRVVVGSGSSSPSSKDPERRVGLVFQRPEAQLFSETVLADVAFGPENLGLSRREAQETAAGSLRAVGLDPETFGPRSPFGLSGGEARRTAIAGVLAMRPRYLLLDEPTAGLDAEGRASILTAITSVGEDSGIAIVTHDLEEFLPLADDVLVLSHGVPLFSGSVGDLMRIAGTPKAEGLPLPDTVRVQLLVRERGVPMPMPSPSPAEAARILVEARGWAP